MREFSVDSSRIHNLSQSGKDFLALQADDIQPVEFTDRFQGLGSQERSQLDERTQQVKDDLIALSHDLYHHPELGFEEHRSVEAVATLLRKYGYQPTVGIHGLDTALRCESSSGPQADTTTADTSPDVSENTGGSASSENNNSPGPTIAIMAEYDALPDIGHACGHNVICSSGLGAFLIAAPIVQRLGARLVLLGTPAEENGTGKEIMISHGALEGIDAAMMVHPYSGVSRTHTTDYLGLRELYVTFRGHTAHASATPYMGVNALDAAVMTYNGLSVLRQQLLFTDRIHAIITEGGKAPNVIPEISKMHLYVRSATTTGLKELSDRLEAVIVAAAQATGCAADLRWDDTPPCLPLRSNEVMAERFALHFNATGQKMIGPQTLVSGAGSTDMGNVSVRVPSIHPMVAIAPAGVSLHTAHFADFAAEPLADDVLIASARSLAGTAADLCADAELMDAVVKEFDEAGGIPHDELDALL
ncbi:MAG: amidohydrolase [Actinomycetaceae bacterium]|nr:amidohydrolase [Actinomycetaceae bacterium]